MKRAGGALILGLILLLSACAGNPLRDLRIVGATDAPAASPESSIPGEPQVTVAEATPEPSYTSPTTGREVEKIGPILATVYENAESARPLSGIAQADIVYEFLLEDEETTELVALFHDSLPETAGPLGACRGYFLRALQQWKPSFVAYFGYDATNTLSGTANLLPELSLTGLDAVGGEAAFSYLADREAFMAALPQLTEGLDSAQASPWTFIQEGTRSDIGAITVTVGDSEWAPPAVYRYDEGLGVYLRYYEGSDDRDADGKQIAVENLVIQHTDYRDTENAVLHMDTSLSSGGDLEVFCGGTCIWGSWTYDDKTGQIAYLDENGNPIALKAGRTWVHVVEGEGRVDYE